MSTILGPLPCQACRQPVAVVRRTIAYVCRAHGPRSRVCTGESLTLTVVELDGTTHICKAAA